MLKTEPFTSEFLDEAANIFISNYKLLKQNYPELPSKYEAITLVKEKLGDIIEKNPAAIVVSNKGLVGYLCGYTGINSLYGKEKGVYIPVWAHGALSHSKGIFLALYRSLAEKWLAKKSYTHIISYFPHDKLLQETLYYLGFGLLTIDGIRAMDEINIQTPVDVIIREMTKQDINDMHKMNNDLCRHLIDSPSFLKKSFSTLDEINKEFFGEKVKTIVAEKKEKIVAGIRGKIGHCSIDVAEEKDTLQVDFGYTDPSLRGAGLGTALLNEVLKWGISLNAKRMTVDFESTNPEGLSFWLRHFQPF